MILAIIAASCVAAGVGGGLILSKNKFKSKMANIKSGETVKVAADWSLLDEVDRFEQLIDNLETVKRNVDAIDIPVPEPSYSWDSADASLKKVSVFFEKHNKAAVGTEAFILSILPVSQTGEALASFASVAPHLLSGAFENSVAALKDGMSLGVDDVSTCLCRFCEGMARASRKSIADALQHKDYLSALMEPVKSGFAEVTGVHDATSSLAESVHDMGDTFSGAMECSLDPMDFTDWDISGHIPVITIAISSFRELSLLLDDKTDALTSLKNIGLDAVGAGGGGMVGAKAGAVVGSAFGPVGALVGMIAGGVGGAMGGRSLTNNIKQRPLKKAIEAYQTNAELMKEQTKEQSRMMLTDIRGYSTQKRVEFKDDELLKEIPVMENENTCLEIAVIMCHSVVEHLEAMRRNVQKMRSSIWYSGRKYDEVIDDYENRIALLEKQLPDAQIIERNPRLALDTILALRIPSQKKEPGFRKTFDACVKELKEMNDRNNSSVLVWSYMVNGLYQKTLNDIAEYSNSKMGEFNEFVESWRQTMAGLEDAVNIEKGKLGLS